MNWRFAKGMIPMGFALMLTSCLGDVDFDPNTAMTVTKNALGITEVDPNHDWNMVSSGRMLVHVSGSLGEKYTVKVYQNNPLADETAILIAKGQVNSGETFKKDLQFSLADTVLFAAVYTPKEQVFVRPVKIGNFMETSFDLYGNSPLTAKARRMTRAEADNYVVPALSETPDISSYADGATEVDARTASETWTGSEYYKTKLKITGEWTTPVSSLAPGGKTLYVSGTWRISGLQQLGVNGVIVVDNGGKIILEDGASLQTTNGGRLFVMHGGEISGKGLLEMANGSQFSYNGGTIDVATLNNNGGTFYNYGTITCDMLQGSAWESKIINHGHITTANTSENIMLYNACSFRVTEYFREPKHLTLGDNSYTYMKSLLTAWGATVYMGHNALMDIEEDARFNSPTIYGPETGNYAIMQMGYSSYTNWGYILNNIFVSVDKTLAPGDENTYNQWNPSPYTNLTTNMLNRENKGNGNATSVVKNATDIYIEASDCHPGYRGDNAVVIEETPQVYTFAFEDTYLGDYDMNDVVIKVKRNADNPRMIDVEAVACGAVKRLYVFLKKSDSETLKLFDGVDIHEKLGNDGVGDENTSFRNTLYSRPKVATATTTVEVGEDFEIGNADFYITNGSEQIHVSSAVFKDATGTIPPYGVCIPCDWKYPAEWQCITKAYPKFAEFAKKKGTATDWYKYPSEDKDDDGNPLYYDK